MADVITRLKLETTQYDSKLRDASKELAAFAREAKTAGTSFQQFAQKNMESARSFGSIATSATNAKDKVKELVNAYNNVAKAYNDLTQEQKQSDFGKAMAQSLETLKGRISEAKQEMQGMSSQGRDTGGIMDALTSKFTLNVDALKLLKGGMLAAETALGVMKDAFFASERNVDEWGRIMESSRSLYEGFLNSLNNSDISGFLNRIDQIVVAARKAYDEIDRLGTLKTIQSPKVSAQMTENERLRLMIQTRRYIAPKDGRRATMKDGQLLSDAQVSALTRQLANGQKTLATLTVNEVKQATKAIEAVWQQEASKLGMSVTEFKRGTSSMEEFEKRLEGAANYQKWQADHSWVDVKTGREIAPRTGNPYESYKGWEHFRVDGQAFNNLVQRILQRDQAISGSYSQQSQAYRTINRAEGITSRIGAGGGGGGGHTGGGGGGGDTVVMTETQMNNARIDALAKQYETASEERRKELREEIQLLQQRNAEIQRYYDIAIGKQREIVKGDTNVNGLVKVGGANASTSATDPSKMVLNMQSPLQNMQLQLDALKEAQQQAFTPEQFAAYQTAIDEVQKKIDKFTGTTDGKDFSKSWQTAAQAISQVGAALQGIDNPAVKVMGIIAEAIANIALAFSMASAQSAKLGVWAWVGATATGLSTMLATIEAIKSATSGNYAAGGIVPGNSYSGDNMRVYGINSGELILNRAQQGNLASQLASPGAYGRLEAVLTAEELRLCINSESRRKGRGEYVTSKFARRA